MAFVVCAAIGVVSLLPSKLVADEMNERIDEVQPTPYARVPSSAQPVDERITFGELEGLAEQYPPSGNFYFVTVTEPSQTILSWLVGRDEPAIEFLTEEQKFGFQTPQQRRMFGLESMRTSEQVAQYVALKAVGYDVTIVPGDVLISEMVCLVASDDGTECLESSPSDEVLDPGDRLLEIDGAPVNNVDDLSAALADKEPGDTVEIKLERPEVGELTVTVELTSSPDEPDRTIVGFLPFDTQRVELPFELDIDTGRIGGPSAGLAFTLTLIDELTPGELTGGQNVAITGTIELDGTVGAIGGLRQKASAVAQAGVDVFLVPAAQGEEDIAARARSRGRWTAHHPGRHRRRGPGGPRGARAVRRSTRFRLPPTNSPECLRWGAWLSRSRDPTRRRPRPSPRRSSRPPAGGTTKTRCASCCAASPPSSDGSKSARSISSASCASPSRVPSTARKVSTTTPSPACSARRRCTSCRPPVRARRRSRSVPRRVPHASCARPPKTPTARASKPRSRPRASDTDAAADAEGEVSLAKQQGREMVNEARAYRERVLSELTRRRELARQQIEQLILGRDRLLQVFERARLVAVDVVAELTPLGEPEEYVDLSPTTGPVPMMVPARSLTGSADRATDDTSDTSDTADTPDDRDDVASEAGTADDMEADQQTDTRRHRLTPRPTRPTRLPGAAESTASRIRLTIRRPWTPPT